MPKHFGAAHPPYSQPPAACTHATVLHFHAPTGGASATTIDSPPARLACDEARTARMGGGGGEDARAPDPQTLYHRRHKQHTNATFEMSMHENSGISTEVNMKPEVKNWLEQA